jgi:hypothetical protein
MKLALLIDADNAQASMINNVLDEVSKYGNASVKRIYGDWTTPHMKSWKSMLLDHSIQPIQQFAYTTGKNATDSAMIIDAMDLLYTGNFDGFCIVSSDSDFTRLAARLKESGKIVYGFGEQKTPKAFINACDKFIHTEVLKEGFDDYDAAMARHVIKLKSNQVLIGTLRKAIRFCMDEGGWANLGKVSQKLTQLFPDFDTRLYGYDKLGDLFGAIDLFEIRDHASKNAGKRSFYVRLRK